MGFHLSEPKFRRTGAMSRHANTAIRTSAGYDLRKTHVMAKLSGALIALACYAALFGVALAAETEPARIKGLRRIEDTVARLGGEGDNWHMSWTNDDRLVAGLCDGTAEP